MTLQELFRRIKERFSRDADVPTLPPNPAHVPHAPHASLPPNPRHAPLAPDHSTFRLGSTVELHDSARLSLDATDAMVSPASPDATPSTGKEADKGAEGDAPAGMKGMNRAPTRHSSG